MVDKAIRDAFFAWKRAEGVPEDLIESLYHYNYNSTNEVQISEYIRIQTWSYREYNHWNSKTELFSVIMQNSYISQSQGLNVNKMRERIAYDFYFRGLIPSVKILFSSSELAIRGKYFEAMILLRSSLEGCIKIGLDAQNTIVNKTFNDIEQPREGVFSQTLGVKPQKNLDNLGLGKLCREVENKQLSGHLTNIYERFNLYELNDYVHSKLIAQDKIGWQNLIFDREFNEKSWIEFSIHFQNVLELILIFTHNIAREHTWINLDELELDDFKIIELFPKYAEELVSDGLIENCIDCRKLNPVKLKERRGRCKTCHDELTEK
tara:strand:- start:873 stop:1835 length:963 start_codon:yes stop_codon:yes gene_type:complete